VIDFFQPQCSARANCVSWSAAREGRKPTRRFSRYRSRQTMLRASIENCARSKPIDIVLEPISADCKLGILDRAPRVERTFPF